MQILVVGDGPLTVEIANLIQSAGHAVRLHYLDTATTHSGNLEASVGAEVELAIEAVITEVTEKWDVITELDHLLPPTVPILTATLNATATEVASWCQSSERVMGFATIPPLASASVVEVMAALQTSDDAIAAAQAFWHSVGREPVLIADTVGGVLPRVVCNLINEAAFALMERVATLADIDLAMQLGTNHPRGPLTWADLIGIDQVVGILEALGNEFGPDMYRPAPLLRQYARVGWKFYNDVPL